MDLIHVVQWIVLVLAVASFCFSVFGGWYWRGIPYLTGHAIMSAGLAGILIFITVNNLFLHIPWSG
jgi:hypothetical protein